MTEKEEIIEILAAEQGYRAIFHDGLCDLHPVKPGVLSWGDAPIDDAKADLQTPLNASGTASAILRGIDLTRYNSLAGRFEYPGGVAILLHRTGPGTSWDVVTRSTSSFHDLSSAATYAAALCDGAQRKAKRYATLRRAYHEHLKTGTPLRDLL